jgi:hypothetical protein
MAICGEQQAEPAKVEAYFQKRLESAIDREQQCNDMNASIYKRMK